MGLAFIRNSHLMSCTRDSEPTFPSNVISLRPPIFAHTALLVCTIYLSLVHHSSPSLAQHSLNESSRPSSWSPPLTAPPPSMAQMFLIRCSPGTLCKCLITNAYYTIFSFLDLDFFIYRITHLKKVFVGCSPWGCKELNTT